MTRPIGVPFAQRAAPLGILLGILIGMLLIAGCRMARMPLPETLAATERMPVSGRQGLRLKRQELSFGPFQAHGVARSWTGGRDRGGASATHSSRRQSYRFSLREADREYWHVACQATLTRVTVDAVLVDILPTDESALYCNILSAEDASTSWELVLRESRERPLAGTLTLGSHQRLDVVGTNRIEHSLPLGSTTGYELREGGSAIGAVEVINKGAVWMRGDLDPDRRRLLGAAAAALLLLDDLRETLAQ
jgi:hypothetical protein